MSSEQTEKWKMMWGAKVLCPNDLPGILRNLLANR